jgi:glycine/D-amino acid oxidase-like deaminating enzyme
MVGIEIPVQGMRDQMLYLKRPEKLAAPHPPAIDDINRQYFRSETGELTLVGSWGLESMNELGVDPDSYRESVDDEFFLRAGERLTRRIPGMSAAGVVSGQAGCDGLTPDKHAVIDQTGPDGFYLAVGHSGTGFKIAPAVGACMEELITEGWSQTADISSFRLSRFAEDKPLVGEYPYAVLWK